MSACKCTITFNCNCQKPPEAYRCPVSTFCLCEKEKKILTIEIKCLYFQRNLDVVILDIWKKLTKGTKGI